MRRVVKETIEVATNELRFGIWDDETEQFIVLTEENKDKLAALLGASPNLLKTLDTMMDDIVINVTKDLMDMWRRQDDLERRIEELQRLLGSF